ncbi:MAG TPA: hypothetical protein EYM49_02035 [Campylobacterales bacterium]|nr:hypothetical protein [Campylobacterales bacterium]
MIKQIAVAFSLMAIVTGCGIEYRDNPKCEKYNYMSFEEFRDSVVIEEPREIEDAGKIYIYGDMLLVNEKRKGIHIINNKDKRDPKNRAFLKIIGNIDMAVKDGYILADSFMDLVVIDINDMDNIREVNRTIDIFPYNRQDYYGGSCNFDFTKGFLLGDNHD